MENKIKNKKTKTDFYREFDELFQEILKTLNNYEKSSILQNYYYNQFSTLIYSNLINNFFTNLTRENVKDFNLPRKKIKLITKEIKILLKKLQKTKSLSSKHVLNEKEYSNFKSDLKKKYPEFLKLLEEIEKIIPAKELKNYLNKKQKEIKKTGNPTPSMNDIAITKYLEMYVNTHNKLPGKKDLEKSLKKVLISTIDALSNEFSKTLEKDRSRMVNEHKKIREGFENRLYERWRIPIDLLESLIVVCLEVGEEKKNKLSDGKTITDQKQVALIKIHARSIQMSYEILALIRSGFADGAHARWRSLHELAITSTFLRENNEEVAQRYLQHDTMKKFKEARDYRKYYKKLGYPPITRNQSTILRREHRKLIQKYGPEFKYKNGFEWIPRSIISNPNFKTMEEYVKMDKLHPFYNWSSNAVHSGSKGFQRLGLIDRFQDDVLVAGPTNYGFADPLNSTAISISQITSNLISLESDFDDILVMKTLPKYIDEIGQTGLEVQKKLKKETVGI